MHIREARADDFAALYALDQACFAPGIAWSRAELRYFLRYPKNFALVAELDPAEAPASVSQPESQPELQPQEPPIAGFAIAGILLRRGLLLGHLITIDVRQQMRRRGIGEALLQAVEQRLCAAGATALVLEVAVDNGSAQAFYRRHGFAPTGRIPGYYLGRIDALTMEKQLAAGDRG